jgi:hypothetical protein
MYHKFFINADDIAMCCIKTKEGSFMYLAMSDKMPVPINPVETMPGKAGEVSKEKFMKVANTEAVSILERLYF